MDRQIIDYAAKVAVSEQRHSATESRLKQLELDVRSIKTHVDKGNVLIGFLVILMPILMQFWLAS